MTKALFRVGTSYDIHRLEKGEGLVLGGVKIPCQYKSIAHSDGDVLLHAISEALLGALALGDLGKFFPDDSKATENMDSSKILLFALAKVVENGYSIGNIDSSLILEKPKLKDYILPIREKIAKMLDVDISCISVKAGTNEGLDSLGRNEAIGAYASVLIILNK